MIVRITASSAILWLAFFLCYALTLNNLHQNPLTLPFNQIDEQGHISYALHLIAHHHWWPDFSHFMMFDVPNSTETTVLNYINHPPTFYWLMKLAHMAFPWWEPIHFRTTTLILYLVAMVLYTRLGIALTMPLPASILYGLMPLLVYLYLQIGFYNNDAMGFLGGTITTFASLHWFRGENASRYILWMGLGVVLASVKLTALLLVGTYVAACILMRFSLLRTLPKHFILYALIAILICTLPYLYFMFHWGSPAPNTPGQLAKLIECGDCDTRGLPPHSGFFQWLLFFFTQLANQLSVTETTFIPICIYIAALVMLFWKNGRTQSLSCGHPIIAMAIASGIATMLTLSIHIAFAWQRYLDYGWIFDSLLRYYLPLLGAYAAVSSYALTCAAPPRKETL